MTTELTRQGYIIDKESLNIKKLASIKKQLTVSPTLHQDFNKNTKPFKVFTETSNNIIVPRYYGLSKFGKPQKTNIDEHKINIIFKGNVRENQELAIKTCIDSIQSIGGGLLCLPCGMGKTLCAINMICQLQLKTLVIVHKTFLQNQWYDRIKQFTNASIGMIRQKKTDVKNHDIVIGMLQSIALIDYPPEIFSEFDFIIIDECHHCPSRVFSRALMKVGGKHTLGLSATPKRNDGLMKVCNWFLGDVLFKLERKTDIGVAVKIFDYDSSNTKFFVEKKKWVNGKMRPFIPTMTTNITKIPERNKFILDILNILRKQKDRKTLVLSGRIAHLEELKKELDKVILEEISKGELEPDEVKTAFYIGRMKEYELEDSTDADIIFASYAMAEEGLDIDALNTLLLATPKSDIIQSVGRIMRKQIQEGDRNPIIIDIHDILSSFDHWGNKRESYYRLNKYEISKYGVYDSKIINMEDKIQKLIQSGKTLEEARKIYLVQQIGEFEYGFLEEDGFEHPDVIKQMEQFQSKTNLDNIFEDKYWQN